MKSTQGYNQGNIIKKLESINFLSKKKTIGLVLIALIYFLNNVFFRISSVQTSKVDSTCQLGLLIAFGSLTLTMFNKYYSSQDLEKTRELKDYLTKPSGKYEVGFEEFTWFNDTICPDPNFNGQNGKDFHSENKLYCHEIISRIYYPIQSGNTNRSFYYSPLVKNLQSKLNSFFIVSKEKINQLSQLKSYSYQGKPAAKGFFPTILFSPGLGCQAQKYENFIIDLVSHGYIVVGINSLFISGDLSLKNGYVVKYNQKYEDDKFDKELMKIVNSDFNYIYEKIYTKSNSAPIFSAMNLQRIGALGHSIGGNVIIQAAHDNPHRFSAVLTLDIGYDPSGNSFKAVSIPHMHIVASTIKTRSSVPIFEIGKHGIIVGISPDEKNRDYSTHMSFTDESTLQYLPAYQTLLWFPKNILHQSGPYGKGDGLEITHATKNYIVRFFNNFIKNESDSELINGKKLTTNSFVKIGVGRY